MPRSDASQTRAEIGADAAVADGGRHDRAPFVSKDATTAALLRSQYDNMLSCIRCGLCLSVCPTYQISFAEEEGPRGRIAMARALTEGYLPLTADLEQHSQTCLLCDACTAICPAGVRMEPLGTMLREVFERSRPRRLRTRVLRRIVFGGVFANMGRFRALCRLGALYQRSGAQAVLRRSGVLRLLRLAALEQLTPPLRARFLVPKGQRWRPAQRDADRRLGLFAGCIMSTAFADTDRATARMLARSGADVIAYPDQGCCGALHVHNGEADGARTLARQNIDAFERSGLERLIVNAAGCGSTLKGYGHLLEDDTAYAARAHTFAGVVRDVNEELADGKLPKPPRAATEVVVTLQEPCHLAHAQRIREAPRRLLKMLPGVRLQEMDEPALCCGSAGVYNVVHPDHARPLLGRKIEAIARTGAPIVVTSNPGCHLQMQAGLRRAGVAAEVKHIVDLLDEAYGGEDAGDVIEERRKPRDDS